MGAWPAWPGDSLRAGIGLVLALCRHHTPTLLKARLEYLPKSSFGRPYVTRAGWSQLAAGRQEDSEGQDVTPVPGEAEYNIKPRVVPGL